MNNTKRIVALKKKIKEREGSRVYKCPNCNSKNTVEYHYKHGKLKEDEEEYKCKSCGLNWVATMKEIIKSVKILNCGDLPDEHTSTV